MTYNAPIRQLFSAFAALWAVSLWAQQPAASAEPPLRELSARMATSDVRLQPSSAGTLSVEVDNLLFFKDNEFAGSQADGYTLPGMWVQPRLTWQPTADVRVSAGLHALVLDGASKYPCYAYHDIATWKGSQYQSGAHVLPYLRAEAQLGRTNIILGDIYGGANHRLMEPLFNPETNLTQDPEMGAQVVFSGRRFWMDVWVNWQSYIFRESTHQEAFTLGLSQRFLLNDPASAFHWYVPLCALGQHRGGEQDATDMGVQTLINGGLGLGLQWTRGSGLVSGANAEVGVMGAWQQAGELWPFDTGGAVSALAALWLWRDVRLFASVLYGRHFVPLYGVPFYSCVSQRQSDTSAQTFSGQSYDSVLAGHIGGEWGHTFARGYELGVKADVYSVRADAGSTSFSFGIYMRCNPVFVLKTFRHIDV